MILHAEHKRILEEMRAEFDLTFSTKSKGVGLDDLPGLERNFVANGMESDAVMNNSVKSESIDKEKKDEANTETKIPFNFTLDLRFLLGSSSKSVEENPTKASRFSVFYCCLLVYYKLLELRVLVISDILFIAYIFSLLKSV